MAKHIALLFAALGATLVVPVQSGAQEPAVQRRQLTSPEIIDGVHCAATGNFSAETFLDGNFRSCPVLNDTTIAGHRFLAGTWITVDSLRRVEHAWLSQNTTLAGHLCKGTGFKGYSTRFREDGSLRLCFLAEDTVIAGVPCVHGSFWTEIRGGRKTVLYAHPDGSLAGCQASRDFRLDGRDIHKWDRVVRDSAGMRSRSPAR